MTPADMKIIELTAETTVEKAIKKIIPIMDERIENHSTACKLDRMEHPQKSTFFKQNWKYIVIAIVILCNTLIPMFKSGKQLTTKQIQQIAKQVLIAKIIEPNLPNRN